MTELATAELLPPPRLRSETLEVSVGADGDAVEVINDHYSHRLRVDHPEVDDPIALARTLTRLSFKTSKDRVVVLAGDDVAEGLSAAGFEIEATIPGYYCGEEDCHVLKMALGGRGWLADAQRAEEIEELMDNAELHPAADLDRGRSGLTRRATRADAPALAALLDDTFASYPTPSGDPRYIEKLLDEGTPFRVIEDDGEVVACASADLVPEAKTAELTDCATRPDQRGRGHMRNLLGDLMHDLKDRGYPTAYTFARARVPGVNIAFAKLGFEYCGRMAQSCRIGTGLEDMNVLARRL